jgi:hypothetical protein
VYSDVLLYQGGSTEEDVGKAWTQGIRLRNQSLVNSGVEEEREMKKEESWIGVDLDGTLALDSNPPYSPGSIGVPIPSMLRRVKVWLEEGIEVRIVTARVSPIYPDAHLEREAVEKWCQLHLGRVLRVTNEKDYKMWELWDDRAVQVIRNTGKRVGNVLR